MFFLYIYVHKILVVALSAIFFFFSYVYFIDNIFSVGLRRRHRIDHRPTYQTFSNMLSGASDECVRASNKTLTGNTSFFLFRFCFFLTGSPDGKYSLNLDLNLVLSF